MKKYLLIALAALTAALSCQKPADGNENENQNQQTENQPKFKNIEIIVGEVTASTVDLGFKPKDKTASYFWDVCEISEWEKYGEKAVWEDLFDEDYIEKGDVTDSGYEMLDEKTTYVVFAAYCDAKGNMLSACDTAHFTTLELKPEDIYPTTLTGDVTFVPASPVYYTNYGDYYESGNDNWAVYAYNSAFTAGLQLEFFKATGATSPEGSYAIDATFSCATGSAFAGTEEASIFGVSMVGCWYYTTNAEGDILDPSGALVSGTVDITKEAAGIYGIKVNGQDLAGHKISCTATGLTFEEYVWDDDDDLLTQARKPAFKARKANGFKSDSRKPTRK